MRKTRIKDRMAVVKIEVNSVKLAKTIYQAIMPELQASNSFGSQVKSQIEKNSLTFFFKAHSTAVLRALINSYLRWFITIKNSLDVINSKDSGLI